MYIFTLDFFPNSLHNVDRTPLVYLGLCVLSVSYGMVILVTSNLLNIYLLPLHFPSVSISVS